MQDKIAYNAIFYIGMSADILNNPKIIDILILICLHFTKNNSIFSTEYPAWGVNYDVYGE